MLSVLLAGLLTQTAPVSARQQGVPIGRGDTVPKVVLSAPSGGWTVDRMLKIEGTVSDASVDPVVVSINGDRYLMRTQGGRFSRKFPAASGKNVVTVMATNKGGTARAQATSITTKPAQAAGACVTFRRPGMASRRLKRNVRMPGNNCQKNRRRRR